MRRFIRTNALWLGCVAVLAPLGVLLGLQYSWLVDLQETSAVAEKAYLENYLEAISNEVEYFYRTQAERALNIPVYYFSKAPEKIAWHLKKKRPEGARELFVAPFRDGEWDPILLVDPRSGHAGRIDDPSLKRAIYLALAPYETLCMTQSVVPTEQIRVDERDPTNRVIINPITDEGVLVGVAGMVLDDRHFRDEVLRTAIDKAAPKFFDEETCDNVFVSVRDSAGRLVLGTDEAAPDSEMLTHRIPFVYSDWELSLGSRYTTPEEWAESNFLLNVSLSALLAVVLIGGVLVTVRIASREIKLSRMKSDFVSNVSHELRTPLASIRVFGEFLRLGRARDETKIREYGEYIETESRRLTQLIDNILDFSKIESGAKTYEFDAADVEDVVAETVRTLTVGLKHKGLRVTFVAPSGPPPSIELDADALAQALANLVDNAVKYSNGSTEVRVRLEHDAREVRIAVEDHGVGISRDEQQKIFERFHRVSTGLVHDVKGSGLGLSIVNHIVRAHGGVVTVDSEVGRGSTFTIHLPLSRGPASEPAPAPIPAGPAGTLERP